MTEKYISVNMDDEKITQIADILSNKTCKKILGYLAEKEASEGDITRDLKLAISTVEYNLNKLIDAGLVRASKNFFWSVKGKKIKTYGLANKKIIISTKRRFSGMIASVIAGGVMLGAIKLFMNYNYVKDFSNGAVQTMDSTAENLAFSSELAPTALKSFESFNYFQDIFIWIIAGFVIGGFLFFLYKLFSRPHFEGEKASAKMQTLVKGGKR